MEFGYTLSRDDCRRAAIAVRRLTPAGRRIALARTAALAMAIAAACVAAVLGLTVSWTAAAAVLAVGGLGVIPWALLSDRFYSPPPQGPIDVGVALMDTGLALTLEGQVHHVPWDQVARVVDVQWAWLLGIGDEWVVLPVSAAPSRAEVARALTTATGRPIG
jgi:hypothetical protein